MSGTAVSIPLACFDGLASVLSGMSGGEYQQNSRNLAYFGDFLWGGIERRTRVLDKKKGKRK